MFVPRYCTLPRGCCHAQPEVSCLVSPPLLVMQHHCSLCSDVFPLSPNVLSLRCIPRLLPLITRLTFDDAFAPFIRKCVVLTRHTVFDVSVLTAKRAHQICCVRCCYTQLPYGHVQFLLVPFFQVLAVTDEPLLFRKTVKVVLHRLFDEARPKSDGTAPRLPNINLKEFAQDVFAIASNEYGCIVVVHADADMSYSSICS